MSDMHPDWIRKNNNYSNKTRQLWRKFSLSPITTVSRHSSGLEENKAYKIGIRVGWSGERARERDRENLRKKITH